MPAERREPPPHLYFVVSAVFHYLGPSFAVLLFARLPVLGVAWLRIVSAAAVFALWRRPWRAFRRADRDARRLLVAWGGVLAVMNCCFYEAIDRLPLGTVAAIEFLPVIVLAAIGARTARNGAALALAVPGVYLLTDVVHAVCAEGEQVRIVSRRGAVEAPVRIDPSLRPGLTFMTMHFQDDVAVNLLTIDAWDPKSGTAEFKATAIRIEKLEGSAAPETGEPATATA